MGDSAAADTRAAVPGKRVRVSAEDVKAFQEATAEHREQISTTNTGTIVGNELGVPHDDDAFADDRPTSGG